MCYGSSRLPLVLAPVLVLLVMVAGAPRLTAQPAGVLDLAAEGPDSQQVLRVYGARGTGRHGVPVAGGFDMDGDTHTDYAVGYMTATDPAGCEMVYGFACENVGEVDLVFGDGSFAGEVDTAVAQERVLRILGEQTRETTGSEIWMDDVTGDGLGDLLICRQNYMPAFGRGGAGALTIVVGNAALRTHAQTLQPLDLGAPPAGVTLTHVWGDNAGDRLCIWARTGDVTGDGIADIVVGADQFDNGGFTHTGAFYVLQGGAHLAAGGVLDVANPSAPALAGRLARVTPPGSGEEFHLGATCQIADLDGNGVSEVLAAATINRAGAALRPANGVLTHAVGGAPDGTLYIAWDDNFATPWPNVFQFSLGAAPGSVTAINGGVLNQSFGEEILGGLDYDADGQADLFVGDLVGFTINGSNSGLGYVFYQAGGLKGLDFGVDAPPPGVELTTLLGPNAGAIGADTVTHGDYDGDGRDDLAFCSPHGRPQGRVNAGIIHVLRGRSGGWPAVVDTAALPSPDAVEIVEIHGARGTISSDTGDTLCYSAAAGDVDGDGKSDLIVNEMVGNGQAPGTTDVGNLLLIRGATLFERIFADGFESGDVTIWDGFIN